MLGQQLDDMQIGALLVAMAQKGESADEIAGAVDAIAARCRPLVSGLPLTLNIGGTGGDRAGPSIFPPRQPWLWPQLACQ